ncbi:hypothetical protein A2U01_0105849, partial [Trifolium medium]|nr:hypothetical protein [Trifolium medium]
RLTLDLVEMITVRSSATAIGREHKPLDARNDLRTRLGGPVGHTDGENMDLSRD